MATGFVRTACSPPSVVDVVVVGVVHLYILARSGPTEVLPLPLLYAALVLLRSSLCLFTVQTHILASDVRCAAVAAAAAATAAYITVFALRKGLIELYHSFFSFALLLFAVAVVRKM